MSDVINVYVVVQHADYCCRVCFKLYFQIGFYKITKMPVWAQMCLCVCVLNVCSHACLCLCFPLMPLSPLANSNQINLGP